MIEVTKKEYVDSEKIFTALYHLKKSGHPYYQFYDDFSTYEQRCKEQDKDGHTLIFGDENDSISDQFDAENMKRTVHENEIEESEGRDTFEKDDECSSDYEQHMDSNGQDHPDIEDDKETDYLTEDPIRKHQFDHNRNTCLTNNYPEMFIDENGKSCASNQEFSFAPAEGNYPTNILDEKDWDIKSWPALHLDGNFGLHHKRKGRLTDQQYFGQRILNKDLRFSKSPGYIFAAAAYIEKKQLTSKANISFMRGKKTTNKEGTSQYDLDDAFTTFEGVRNTPKYWQKVKYDMIAKLENLGPFHMFFNLSCGDTRCNENFSSVLIDNNYTMDYFVEEDGTTETKVSSEDGRITNKPLNQFLQEDKDSSLHEMIRTNVLTATRNFQHRLDSFRKEIMMGKNNPMKIKKY